MVDNGVEQGIKPGFFRRIGKNIFAKLTAVQCAIGIAFSRLGIAIIDADIIARQVVEPNTPALKAIADQIMGWSRALSQAFSAESEKIYSRS
jgi:hypothetical protein